MQSVSDFEIKVYMNVYSRDSFFVEVGTEKFVKAIANNVDLCMSETDPEECLVTAIVAEIPNGSMLCFGIIGLDFYVGSLISFISQMTKNELHKEWMISPFQCMRVIDTGEKVQLIHKDLDIAIDLQLQQAEFSGKDTDCALALAAIEFEKKHFIATLYKALKWVALLNFSFRQHTETKADWTKIFGEHFVNKDLFLIEKKMRDYGYWVDSINEAPSWFIDVRKFDDYDGVPLKVKTYPDWDKHM